MSSLPRDRHRRRGLRPCGVESILWLGFFIAGGTSIAWSDEPPVPVTVPATSAGPSGSPSPVRPSPLAVPSGSREDAPIPGYCGLYSLHTAMKTLGRDVPFAELVSPRYLGSRKGSSAAELCLAATEHGFQAHVVRNMTCQMLEIADTPILLHVRSTPLATDYDHWMLFLGCHGGRVRIYDGAGTAKSLPQSELSALWDGIGIVVSDRPISLWPLYATGFGTFTACLLLVLTVRAAIPSLVVTGLAGAERWRVVGREVVLLLIATAAFIGGLAVFAPGGYLGHPAMIAGIRDRHIADLCPDIPVEKLQSILQGASPPIVIDARMAPDFKVGHIPGAINFPADSTATPQRARALLAGFPRSTPVVIYCQSAGCSYDEHIARLLDAEGFADIRFFSGGWLEWQARTSP